MTAPKVQRALISVSDKSGLADFAQGLVAAGVQILSTGGSRAHLEQAGIPVTDVSEYTGFPEMMDGRLKTLHPKVHGGILCRHDNPSDLASLAEHEIQSIELVVVNLYPFRETIAQPNVSLSDAIEKIDIGGPTMVRAAAKNYKFCAIASNPAQYSEILAEISANGFLSENLRLKLSREAFTHTAEYDTAISNYFIRLKSDPTPENTTFAPSVSLNLNLQKTLRYGENPHQNAALYTFADTAPHALVNAKQLNGKELSYNNLLDLDSALRIARSLPSPGVAVLKHNNPCGAATADTLGNAIVKAWEGDPQSAFGSVLGVNVPVDADMANYLSEPGRFVEAIVAPEFTSAALEVLTTKPKWKANVRLLTVGQMSTGSASHEFRQIDGGMLCQAADDLADLESAWTIPTATKPSDALLAELRFAWAVCRHVKSNAIVLTKNQSLVGAGAGQMSRVDAVEISIKKAGPRAAGSVLASDAFFPFDDSIGEAAKAGVLAIIQPGGSRRDEEVIAACDKHHLPMIFTGCRHFRH